MATLEELDEQIKALQAQRQALAKDQGIPLVREVFAPLFEYPIVQTIEWTQYTPFFNDGDPCEFRVNAYLSFNGDADRDEDGNSQAFNDYNLPDGPVFVRQAYKKPAYLGHWENNPQAEARRQRDHEEYQDRKWAAFQRFRDAGLIGSAVDDFKAETKKVEKWLKGHEDFLSDAFGDHVKVIVSRDGIEVEEYEHD